MGPDRWILVDPETGAPLDPVAARRATKPRIPLGQRQRPDPDCIPCRQARD